MNRRIDLLPVACALGAPDAGTADGPAALRAAGMRAALQRNGVSAAWLPALQPDAGARWDALGELCARLAAITARSITQGNQPWVLGGDHAIAAGTWRGVAHAAARPIGLLWIDAHLDAHVPEDSPTGNPHGMPLAALLGAGDARLASGALSPRHVCVLGARSWEDAELQRLRRLGVRLYDAAEIARRGLPQALRDALRSVAAPGGFGISIDLDVFNPLDAPGVSVPAPGGLPAALWLEQLAGLARRTDCLAVEIVECDPTRDVDGRTVRLAVQLAAALCAPAAADLVAVPAA